MNFWGLFAVLVALLLAALNGYSAAQSLVTAYAWLWALCAALVALFRGGIPDATSKLREYASVAWWLALIASAVYMDWKGAALAGGCSLLLSVVAVKKES
jgi:hypothetical protein